MGKLLLCWILPTCTSFVTCPPAVAVVEGFKRMDAQSPLGLLECVFVSKTGLEYLFTAHSAKTLLDSVCLSHYIRHNGNAPHVPLSVYTWSDRDIYFHWIIICCEYSTWTGISLTSSGFAVSLSYISPYLSWNNEPTNIFGVLFQQDLIGKIPLFDINTCASSNSRMVVVWLSIYIFRPELLRVFSAICTPCRRYVCAVARQGIWCRLSRVVRTRVRRNRHTWKLQSH